jgi:hypothetical protein
MVASNFTLNAPSNLNSGTGPPSKQVKLGGQTPGPQSLNQSTIHWWSVARCTSLNQMAACNMKLDAIIQDSFSGSELVHQSELLLGLPV